MLEASLATTDMFVYVVLISHILIQTLERRMRRLRSRRHGMRRSFLTSFALQTPCGTTTGRTAHKQRSCHLSSLDNLLP